MNFEDILHNIREEGASGIGDIVISTLDYLSDSLFDWFEALNLNEYESAADVMEALQAQLDKMAGR